MNDYKTIATRVLFEHPFVRVVQDTLEKGGKQRLYYYIESPVEAVATVGLTEGRIVLTRQYRHPVGRAIYDLPAGRLSAGEPPLEGARREFEEETGYHPARIEPLGY